ncbi:MAG: hypothetical protein QOI74_1085 [Micromonosporaceae bacterium]|nr:hypothetical protein [Micromonosporaceae bacterium]
MILLRRLLVSVAAASVAAAGLAAAPAQAHAPITATGSISGTLTTPAGAPVADVIVEARQTSEVTGFSPFAVTGAAGEYTIADLAPGRYKVAFTFRQSGQMETEFTQWAHRATEWSAAAWVQVKAGATTTVDEVTFPTGSLSVRVSDSSGAPISGFCADAVGDRYAATDCTTTGTLTLADLPVGQYVLWAKTSGEPSATAIDFAMVDEGSVTAVALTTGT